MIASVNRPGFTGGCFVQMSGDFIKGIEVFIESLLRSGKTPSGPEVRTLIKHLVRRIRRQWPRTRIVFRGDAHYGRAQAMA